MSFVPSDPRTLLIALYQAAVAAADPARCIAQYLPEPPRGRTLVVGAGKGAAQLARALEAVWPGPLQGTVVTRYGHAVKCERIEVLEAGHPLPDENGLAASARLFAWVQGLTPDDLVIALICGGGSALLPAPPPGFTLMDEIALNRALISSGAPISVMNALRRRFSRIKGGRLAQAAHPARVVNLVVSDIPGDHLYDVASGPTIPADEDTLDIVALLDAWPMALPAAIRSAILACTDTPTPTDTCFGHHTTHVLASARQSLQAAAAKADALGLEAVILSDAIEGEARDAGWFHAALALEMARQKSPFSAPKVLLSGGETTVTLRQPGGRGGRNSEFALAFASKIAGSPHLHALIADTDGIDGTGDNAGAFVDGTSLPRLRQRGIDPHVALLRHESWGAFHALGDLFSPGPTGTNVNDFRAIMIG